MEPSKTSQIDEHAISYAAADLQFVTLRGTVTPQAMMEIIEETFAVMDKQGHVFTLCDVTTLRDMPPETRRLAHQEMTRRPPFRGSTAVFGASAPMRLLLSFVMNAVRLVTGRGTEELMFLKDRESALSWLLGRRQALTGAVPPSGFPWSALSLKG